MGNWLAHIKAPAAVAGLAVLLLASAAALVVPASTAVAAEKKQELKLTEEVAAKLKPAQDAFQKGDFDTCIARAQEALPLAKKPYDKQMSLQFQAQCLAKKQDYNGYADVIEQVQEIDIVPADEKLRNAKNLASIFYQAKNYPKAEKWAKAWAEGSNLSEAYHLLMAIYYSQQDCANTIVAQEKENELDRAAGKDATEQSLKILNNCYYKTNDKDHRQAVMEELVRRFPKSDYFTDLLQLYEEQKLDKRAKLNLYRFGVAKDWISRESQFVDYADEALDAGAPAEALKVIETATAKGAFKIISQTDHNGRLMAAAKQQTAEDKKLIGQLDKEARSKANGEADVKVGLAYMGFGEYDKAAEAIARGLTADRVGKVKRVDDAQMMLGICYKNLGKTEEAKKAFTAAQQDPRMAKAASVWLQSL
jgi:tetratricopeptide (TPR) repeat protein